MHRSPSYTLADHMARDCDRYAQAKYEITRRWLARLPAAGKTLLNIGCGGGYFNRVAFNMGFSVIACEPDPEAYELAMADRPDGSVKVFNCGLDALVNMSVTGDVIVFHDVLEHIADDREAAGLLRMLLNAGGRIIISVPALAWLYGRHDEELGHYRRYSASALRGVLESQGFSILRMRFFGALSIPIVLGFSKILRRSYPRSAGGTTRLGRVYGAMCDFETRVTFPIGTSLIAMLKAGV